MCWEVGVGGEVGSVLLFYDVPKTFTSGNLLSNILTISLFGRARCKAKCSGCEWVALSALGLLGSALHSAFVTRNTLIEWK